MELSGGCTRNGTCPLVPRNGNRQVFPTNGEMMEGCTRNGTCPLVPRSQNWHSNVSDLEHQGGCTANGTCPLVPRNGNRQAFPINGEIADGCTRNGTCPLVPRNENGYKNVSVLEPQGGCTRNGTCPLVPRKQIPAAPIYTEPAGGCTRNGTCSLVPRGQNWHSNISYLEHQGGCTTNGTCPLVPRNGNRQAFPIIGEMAEGCTRNGTCPLVPRNYENVLDIGPQGGCTRNGTCPVVPRGWNFQNAAEGAFEGVCDQNGATPYRRGRPTGDFSSQKHNGGCTANGTCPFVPLEQNWIMNDFQLGRDGTCTLNPQTQNWNTDVAYTDNTYITRNGRCPVRPQNQNWHQNVENVQPMGDCTCPSPGNQRWNFDTGDKETEQCIRNILRPWKAPIHFWHLTASEMEMTGGCTKNECPIIRCKHFCNVRTAGRCCRRYNRKAMYIIKIHNQVWQLDARDLGLTEDCKTKGMSPEMPLQPECPFESLKPAPAGGFNEKRDTTITGNCNMNNGNAFQHNEQCECTFCRVQYRPELSPPIVDQLIGEPQCGRNGLHGLAQQKQGRCNGLDSTLPTEVCETGNCHLSQNRRYNGWVPQMEAETWNGNTTCMRVSPKQYWENTDPKKVLGWPEMGVCAANPRKHNRTNTEPAILCQRNRKCGGRQKRHIISHNSTKDELFIQSHQY